MAHRLDRIIVVDIESTCWEGLPPPDQENEIIEIGVCIVDCRSLTRTCKESILVRPEYSTVSDFCTRLTTLTQAQVEAGVSFREACDYLRSDFQVGDCTWASYGDYDRVAFQRQCERLGVPYPFNRTHINVKNLLALGLNLPREVGLDAALDLLHLPLEGTHHRGHDDAWNIAAILAILIHKLRTANP